MRGWPTLLTVLVCGVMFQSMVHAAELLSWQECVNIAAKDNRELLAATRTLESAQYAIHSAASGYYPQVSASVSYNRGNGSMVSAAPGMGSGDADTAAINASVNLFNGYLDAGKVAQASAQSEIQEVSLAAVKSKVSVDLKTAYAGLLYANRSMALQQDIIHRREENLKLVQLRYQSGGENKGSVLLSAAYLQQANYDALQARDNVVVQQSALARIFGRDDEQNITVTEDVPLETLPASPDFNQRVLDTPDHRQAYAQQQVADAGLTIARSGLSPTVALNASAGVVGDHWYPDSDRWLVGATLTVPLFNGHKDYYNSKSALATLEAATALLDNTDKQVVTNLRQGYTAYVEAIQKLQVDESFKEAALKRAEIARSKYNNGLMTFEDWDLIESDLINRQKTVLQSQRDMVIAEAAWQQVRGAGVIP